VVTAAREAGLSDADVYSVQLAVDEACANIIEHAYGGEGNGDIECTCSVRDDRLIVLLSDTGCPFDPRGVPSPNLTAELENRETGGLGVYLMTRMMDEVHFERDGVTNTLTMVKRVSEVRP